MTPRVEPANRYCVDSRIEYDDGGPCTDWVPDAYTALLMNIAYAQGLRDGGAPIHALEADAARRGTGYKDETATTTGREG